MGAEATHRTCKALLEAVRARALRILDSRIERNKGTNPLPLLRGVPGILETLRSGETGLAHQRQQAQVRADLELPADVGLEGRLQERADCLRR